MVPHSNKCEAPLLGAQCDSEEQRDVVFMVCGPAGERWRVPGHRRVLAAASPVFAAMLLGPLAETPDREVLVHDVERRAFDLLLRYMYGETVQLQSVDTALATLYAAHKYQCEALEIHCLTFLSSHIDASTVLVILHYIRVYCNLLVTPITAAPSAPSLEVIESAEEDQLLLKTSACHLKENPFQNNCKISLVELISSKSTDKLKLESTECNPKVPSQCTQNLSKMSMCDISHKYKLLMQHCLEFIDLNIDKVLQQEQIDELGQEELLFIVQRDTLRLSSEVVLFQALEQWSKSICKRNCWELSPTNRREALGNELLFSVRYILMTSEDFINSPMGSKLLSSEECNYLLGHILKHSVIPSLPTLEKLLPTLMRPRQKAILALVGSSHHSDLRPEFTCIDTSSKTSQMSSKSKKNSKKKKDQCRKEDVRLQEKKPNMSDYFFSCIACIFD